MTKPFRSRPQRSFAAWSELLRKSYQRRGRGSCVFSDNFEALLARLSQRGQHVTTCPNGRSELANQSLRMRRQEILLFDWQASLGQRGPANVNGLILKSVCQYVPFDLLPAFVVHTRGEASVADRPKPSGHPLACAW